MATWTWRLRSAPRCSRTACCMRRPRPESWRTPTRKRSGRRRCTRRAPSCTPRSWRARDRPERGADMVLMLDNYDSFTYNLVQYLGELGAAVKVLRNDEATVDEV